MTSLPPEPAHILRLHTAAIAVLVFSHDNERLYSGDAAGRVALTSTRTLRPLAAWPAHTDALLAIHESSSGIITHARDNKLHVWRRVRAARAVGDAAAAEGTEGAGPELVYSMDVNALNYCRFSLWEEDAGRALIALPNLVESSLADVWELPSRDRLHAAIGKPAASPTPFATAGRGEGQHGIIMSLHLFQTQAASSPQASPLRLLAGYEDGAVVLWAYTREPARKKSIEGIGWEPLWTSKLHVESVMALAVTRDHTLALSVSADPLVGRYDLTTGKAMATRIKQVGNGALALRDDGRVCAIAGWDGRVRLFGTKTLKPLGTLSYHKDGCQAVAFARGAPQSFVGGEGEGDGDSDSDDEMGEDEKEARARWLVSGGKDSRIAVWPLMRFDKS